MIYYRYSIAGFEERIRMDRLIFNKLYQVQFKLDKKKRNGTERYDKHIYRKRETTNVQTKNKKVVGTHDADKKKSNTHKCYYFSIDR